MITYRKVRFYSPVNGATAGLIVETNKLANMSIPDISRLFPYSEANKMQRIQCSPEYGTFEAAFLHEFKEA